MQQKAVDGYARAIAQRLLVIQHGGMDLPKTWADVADRRGHDWEYFDDPDSGPGEWVSCEAGTGVIRINTAYPSHIQAHTWVHEISHAELCALASGLWQGNVPGFLRGNWACLRPGERMGYDDDPADCRHRIACRVEEICFRRV